MSKRTEDLAFKYNIRANVDELSMFVSEIYNDGYHAGLASDVETGHAERSIYKSVIDDLKRELYRKIRGANE